MGGWGESGIQSKLCWGRCSTGSVGPTRWTCHRLDQVGFPEEMPPKLQEKEGKRVLLEGRTRSMGWMVSRGDTCRVRLNPVGLRAPLPTPTRHPPKLWDSQFTGPSDLSLGPPCDAFPPSRVQAHLAEGDVRLRMYPRAPLQCCGEPSYQGADAERW